MYYYAIGLAIGVWLYIGWFSHAVVQGYFWHRFESERSDTNWFKYSVVHAVMTVFGVLTFLGAAQFILDRNRIDYAKRGPRYHYWHRPEIELEA